MQREWRQIGVDQGTEFAGEFKKFCSAQGIESYSRKSETKAAFAERTKRSLKNFLYRYMEDYGYKYDHILPQFIATLTSRNNRTIDMEPNHVKDSDFMSILYSKLLREYKKTKFGTGFRARISKYDLPFRKSYKQQIHKKFLKILPLLLKNLQHIQSTTNKKKLYVGNSTRRN